MKLYLAQHGQAVDKNVDPDRPLSDQGHTEVGNVASYLKQSDTKITDIYHSGKPRAAQTANIFANILEVDHLDQLDGINPNDAVEPIVNTINGWTSDTMIVGHIPFLPHIVSRLLTDSEPSDSDYLPGNIICLERADNNKWSLAGCCTYASFNKTTD